MTITRSPISQSRANNFLRIFQSLRSQDEDGTKFSTQAVLTSVNIPHHAEVLLKQCAPMAFLGMLVGVEVDRPYPTMTQDFVDGGMVAPNSPVPHETKALHDAPKKYVVGTGHNIPYVRTDAIMVDVMKGTLVGPTCSTTLMASHLLSWTIEAPLSCVMQ